jgi:hypothetical protein
VTERRRLAVIGAGPLGLEAGLRGVQRGWDVTVLEKGPVGNHCLQWGHVQLFTELRDNVSSSVRDLLPDLPDPSAVLTGRQFVDHVLQPLAQSPPLKGAVQEHTEVLAVARRRARKTALPGHPLRLDRPFQMLIRSAAGEHTMEVDAVLDASGVYGTANWAGESGIPCVGEREAGTAIVRRLPDIMGQERSAWAGKDVLVVGSGHSAATALVWLEQTRREGTPTRVHWVVNTDRARPCDEVSNDPLPARRSTVMQANDLAERPPEGWRIYRRSALLSLRKRDGEAWTAEVGRREAPQSCRVDRVLSLTGYRPDTSLLEELQIHLSPVTGGAGALARSLMDIKDCLSPVMISPESLASGEKNFFLVGHKSYGRLNNFLMRTGREQLDAIFRLLK